MIKGLLEIRKNMLDFEDKYDTKNRRGLWPCGVWVGHEGELLTQ